ALVVVVPLVGAATLAGEPPGRRVHRRPLRDRPRAHDAVDLEPQVPVVRSRDVLLDDEHSRRHAADRELLVALDVDLLDVDSVDPRAARTLVEERDEVVDGFGRPFGVDVDGAVVLVADPAQDTVTPRAAHRYV